MDVPTFSINLFQRRISLPHTALRLSRHRERLEARDRCHDRLALFCHSDSAGDDDDNSGSASQSEDMQYDAPLPPRRASHANNEESSAKADAIAIIQTLALAIPHLARCAIKDFRPSRGILRIGIAAVLAFLAIKHQGLRAPRQVHHQSGPPTSSFTAQEDLSLLEGRRRSKKREQQLDIRPSLGDSKSSLRSRSLTSQPQPPHAEEVEVVDNHQGPLQDLRFLTLNVNSINGDEPKMKERRDTLLYLMQMDRRDVVFLQQSHHSGDGRRPPSYALDFKNCGYRGFWSWGSTSAAGGVATFISKRALDAGLITVGKSQDQVGNDNAGGWKHDAEKDGKASKGRLLCLRVTIFDVPCVLINLHIPCANKIKHRKVAIQALKTALGRYRGTELVVGGDFNGVLDSHDIIPDPDPSDKRITKHKEVTLLLDSHGATDTWRHVMGNAPTFTHKYKNRDHGGSRLDTFALTSEAIDRVIPNSMAHVLGYPGDHLGVSLTLLGRLTTQCWAEWQHKQPGTRNSADMMAARTALLISSALHNLGINLKQGVQRDLQAARAAKSTFEKRPQRANGEAFQEAQKALQEKYTQLAAAYWKAN